MVTTIEKKWKRDGSNQQYVDNEDGNKNKNEGNCGELRMRWMSIMTMDARW